VPEALTRFKGDVDWAESPEEKPAFGCVDPAISRAIRPRRSFRTGRGRYVLNAQKAGYVSPVGTTMPRLEVAASERHVLPDLTVAVGGVITGRVVDPSGQPVVNAPVMALRAGAPRNASIRQGGISERDPPQRGGWTMERPLRL